MPHSSETEKWDEETSEIMTGIPEGISPFHLPADISHLEKRMADLEEKFEKAFPSRSDIIHVPKAEDINRILEEGLR